jgi:hypothetical protein
VSCSFSRVHTQKQQPSCHSFFRTPRPRKKKRSSQLSAKTLVAKCNGHQNEEANNDEGEHHPAQRMDPCDELHQDRQT